MGFWVEEKEGKSKSEGPSEDESRNLGLELIAIGKRIGFSLAEINEFRGQDLIDLVNIMAGDAGEEEEKQRMATQEDIDRFYM